MQRLRVKKTGQRRNSGSRCPFYGVLLIAGDNSVSVATREETPLKIVIRKAGAAAILDLNGPLRLGEGEEDLRGQIQNLVDSGDTHAAVNLAGITHLDSSGIGALVRSFASLKRAGGKCIFFAPTKQVLMLLRMVRLDTVLEIVEDEATALARI